MRLNTLLTPGTQDFPEKLSNSPSFWLGLCQVDQDTCIPLACVPCAPFTLSLKLSRVHVKCQFSIHTHGASSPFIRIASASSYVLPPPIQ